MEHALIVEGVMSEEATNCGPPLMARHIGERKHESMVSCSKFLMDSQKLRIRENVAVATSREYSAA
jgi:hypothetical protein